MNTANLQLEGLLVAVAAVLRSLRAKGAVGGEEVEAALRQAEEALAADRLRPEALSPAHVEAVLFPLRFLRVANARQDSMPPPGFSEIATQVGQGKRRAPSEGAGAKASPPEASPPETSAVDRARKPRG